MPAFVIDPRQLQVEGTELVHVTVTPAFAGETVEWPAWVAPEFVAALTHSGIRMPWRHQVDFADSAHSGTNTILATGTASGKTIAFAAPAITSTLQGGTVLYLAPTKALAADQLNTITNWNIPGVRAATYDGDTPHEERQWARKHANYLLTNPDMLHFSMLPGHRNWSHFLRHLTFVIVDEAHIYKGVFGAHVALILRRLLRLARKYGGNPTVLAASATSGNPADLLAALTGRAATAITASTAATPERTFAFWQPPVIEATGARRGVLDESSRLLASVVEEKKQVVAFARSRRGVEYLATTTREILGNRPGVALTDNTVRAYRGGYLAHERRDLENDLRSGETLAMAATNALELGIDITGLDVVITAGWPGTKASLLQQVGRAGRGTDPALAIYVAREDPLDTFVLNHPETIFSPGVESTIVNPGNPIVMAPHLCAAAAEIPITDSDLDEFFPSNTREVLDQLSEGGMLRKRATGWYWTQQGRASELADLRGTGGEVIRVVEKDTGRLCGFVDNAASHRTVHEGAVYTHQGETFVVHELDLDGAVALVEQVNVDFTTFARDVSDIRITGIDHHREVSPGLTIHYGNVEVSSQTVSFTRRHLRGENLGTVLLDLPVRSLNTMAVWWTFDQAMSQMDQPTLAGAIHGAEHAAIGILPLFASCDRWDIGGVSTITHPDTAVTTIFIYDGLAGGAGIAEFGFHHATEWITATLQSVSACSCELGCPACIQSPKCGNGNEPLSKSGAISILTLLRGSPDS